MEPRRGLTVACLFASMLAALAFSVPSPSAGEASHISVTFGFAPAKASYAPGENVTIEFTVVNTMPSVGEPYDELASMVKVLNISARFSWMAPNEYAWKDVSAESSWLAPGGEGFGTYGLQFQVPADAQANTYTYVLKVEYLAHTYWGDIKYTWGGDMPYRDFVVSASSATQGDGKVNYVPYIAAMVLVLAVGAAGAVLYYKSQKGAPTGAPPKAKGVGARGNGYPVIHPVPGEHFPVERGFIYLVKEKRPYVAFQMFNEATSKGAKGMLVVREHPDRMMQLYKFDARKILWLTRRVGKDHADPTELSLLSHKISRFVDESGRSVVLLEGLEYMITQNDFETVLRFVDHLHDFVLAHDCAVIVVVDPRVLSTRELALLERSAKIVEPLSSAADSEAQAEA